MKVQIQLQGQFHRLPLTGEAIPPVSLSELLQRVQTVAGQSQRRTPQLLRQSFGLEFIPESILVQLLQQTNGVNQVEDLYQIPGLQLLHRVSCPATPQQANTYRYKFTSPEATLDLLPDDVQLPRWREDNTEQPGHYTLILNSPHYPGLNSDFTQPLWQYVVTHWETQSDLEKIHSFVTSLNRSEVTFRLSPQIQAGISLEELPLSLREAIAFLRQGEGDSTVLSTSVQSLVQAYQTQYQVPVFCFPENLSPNPQIQSQQKVCIRRGNRQYFQAIIQNAKQFLLLSSYIIEDEDLTRLVCEKSSELPQGVWILTDLRNEVIDQIDIQVDDSTHLPDAYQRSNERKVNCIRQLLRANVRLRSGKFHLKTCISEQAAYLGSCNLTPGSLDVNLEAGIIWQNSTIHSQLIHLFQKLWQSRSRDEVCPALNLDGFILRPLRTSFTSSLEHFPNLLTPHRYYLDLRQELQKFQGKVLIFSRSFRPDPEFKRLLEQLKTQVVIDSQMSASTSKIKVIKRSHIHAKITLLGNKVAYIGGINLSFSKQGSSLHDLMYKTTNSQEIVNLKQAISQSFQSQKR